MVWFWVTAWLVLALAVSLVVVRGVRLADRRAARTTARIDDEPNFVVDDQPSGAQPQRHRSERARHAVPPPVPQRSRPRTRRR